MKKTLLFILSGFLISFLHVSGRGNFTTVPNYVGVELCGLCHKTEKQGNQFSIWRGSAHSRAFSTLLSEKANQIARDKGYSVPAVEVMECLKCHATGFDLPAERLGGRFKISDGVQCETCHGPGSEYKELHIMKNRELSEQKGLFIPDSREEFCKNCHNEQSPTYVSFDFDKAWTEISHPVPEINK